MRYLTGTIAELKGKVAFNGVTLSQPDLSYITRLFEGTIFKQVGAISVGRGRPTIVWQIDTENAIWLEAIVNSGLTASDNDGTIAKVA